MTAYIDEVDTDFVPENPFLGKSVEVKNELLSTQLYLWFFASLTPLVGPAFMLVYNRGIIINEFISTDLPLIRDIQTNMDLGGSRSGRPYAEYLTWKGLIIYSVRKWLVNEIIMSVLFFGVAWVPLINSYPMAVF